MTPTLAEIYQKGTTPNPSCCAAQSGINDPARNTVNRSELSKSDNVPPGSTFSLDGNRSCCHIIIKVSQMRSSLTLQQMLNKNFLILTGGSAEILLLELRATEVRKWHWRTTPISCGTSGISSRSLQSIFPLFSSKPEQSVMQVVLP